MSAFYLPGGSGACRSPLAAVFLLLFLACCVPSSSAQTDVTLTFICEDGEMTERVNQRLLQAAADGDESRCFVSSTLQADRFRKADVKTIVKLLQVRKLSRFSNQDLGPPSIRVKDFPTVFKLAHHFQWPGVLRWFFKRTDPLPQDFLLSLMKEETPTCELPFEEATIFFVPRDEQTIFFEIFRQQAHYDLVIITIFRSYAQLMNYAPDTDETISSILFDHHLGQVFIPSIVKAQQVLQDDLGKHQVDVIAGIQRLYPKNVFKLCLQHLLDDKNRPSQSSTSHSRDTVHAFGTAIWAFHHAAKRSRSDVIKILSQIYPDESLQVFWLFTQLGDISSMKALIDGGVSKVDVLEMAYDDHRYESYLDVVLKSFQVGDVYLQRDYNIDEVVLAAIEEAFLHDRSPVLKLLLRHYRGLFVPQFLRLCEQSVSAACTGAREKKENIEFLWELAAEIKFPAIDKLISSLFKSNFACLFDEKGIHYIVDCLGADRVLRVAATEPDHRVIKAVVQLYPETAKDIFLSLAAHKNCDAMKALFHGGFEVLDILEMQNVDKEIIDGVVEAYGGLQAVVRHAVRHERPNSLFPLLDYHAQDVKKELEAMIHNIPSSFQVLLLLPERNAAEETKE